MRELLVSIVIVHWDETDLLRTCLQSLEKSDYPNIELIVSDNGSSDGAVEMVRTEFPRVHLIAEAHHAVHRADDWNATGYPLTPAGPSTIFAERRRDGRSPAFADVGPGRFIALYLS